MAETDKGKGKDQAARTRGAESNSASSTAAGLKAKNPTSTARGPYQILDGTWAALEKTANRKLDRNSPADNDLAFELYTKNSERILAKNGIEATPGNTYALHVFGPAGGIKYLQNAKSNPDGLSTEGMSAAVINGNKAFFYGKDGKPRTNADSYGTLAARVGGKSDPGKVTLEKKNNELNNQMFQQRQMQQMQMQQPEQEQPEQPEESSEEPEQQQQQQEAPVEETSELSQASNASGMLFNGDRKSPGRFILPSQQKPIQEDIKTSGDASMKAKTFRYGGPIASFAEGGDINNGLLNDFNEGGKHEENPNGGIPQGMDPSGALNTVEEGETKMGQYVFSDRLKLDKMDVENLYLPKQVEGMTYADASKFINGFLEDNPFDIIIKKTAQSQLDSLIVGNDRARKFKEEEEQIVAETDNPQAAQQYKLSSSQESEMPAEMTGEMPVEEIQEEPVAMAYGGKQYRYRGQNRYADGGEAEEGEVNTSGLVEGGIAGLTGMASLAGDIFKKHDTNNLDNVIEKQSVGGSAFKGAMSLGASGFKIGNSLGIPGAGIIAGGIGAVAGAVGGIFGAKNANNAAQTQAININAGAHNNQYGAMVKDSAIRSAAYGGRQNKLAGGGPGEGTMTDEEFANNLVSQRNDMLGALSPKPQGNVATYPSFVMTDPYAKTQAPVNSVAPVISQPSYSFTKSGNFQDKTSKLFQQTTADRDAASFQMRKDSPLKYAGAAGALGNFLNSRKEKARQINSELITKTSSPNYYDEAIIQNAVGQERNNRDQVILGTSGGSASAARAMSFAGNDDINKLKSDSYFKMFEANNGIRNADQAEAQRISEGNVGIRNADYQANLAEQDYVLGRKEKARDNMYSSLEAIGTEQNDRNLVYNLSRGYNVDGSFDPEGKNTFMANLTRDYQALRSRNKKASGGLLDLYESSLAKTDEQQMLELIKKKYNG